MKTSLRNRRRRGGATVELALTMIVVVPLVAYAIFLDNYTLYFLDWQESIVSSPWDYTTHDYTKPMDPGTIQHVIRLEFCDHSTAYSSWDANYDCSENTHHAGALGAHQCWLATGGEQVTCSKDDSIGKNIEYIFGNAFNKGGLISCTSKLGVQNYFMMQKFFHWWAKKDVTDHEKQTGSDIHGNAQGSASANVWVFGDKTPDYAGVVTDPWACNHVDAVDPGPPATGNDFFKRMNTYYQFKAGQAGMKGFQFGQKMSNDKLISPMAYMADSALGDNVMTPSMAFKLDAEQKFGQYSAIGYNVDSRQSDTEGQRSDDYMGEAQKM